MPKPTSQSPFDWMEPRRNPNRPPIEAAGRAAMYRAELEERAALLQRLGHGKRAGARRAWLANLAWDFPPAARPLDDRTSTRSSTACSDRTAARPAPRAKGGPR